MRVCSAVERQNLAETHCYEPERTGTVRFDLLECLHCIVGICDISNQSLDLSTIDYELDPSDLDLEKLELQMHLISQSLS